MVDWVNGSGFASLGSFAVVEDAPAHSAVAISIKGPVTLGEVARLRDDLADALARSGGLRLDLSGSGPWDLAGTQLLLAVAASCERVGGTLCLTSAPAVFLSMVERSGLLDRFSPLFDAKSG